MPQYDMISSEHVAKPLMSPAVATMPIVLIQPDMACCKPSLGLVRNRHLPRKSINNCAHIQGERSAEVYEMSSHCES